MDIEPIENFVKYANTLDGDEKGEAQVFLDRFFQAFGHKGYKEAGATLERRVCRKDKGTSFADLVWEPRLLIEMKKRGENLIRHYDQMRDYWHDIYPKPKYAILCNFDEFWIYDFFTQSEPVDKVLLEDFTRRHSALNFMLPHEKKPLFQNDMESVSREAASKVANIFNCLIENGETRDTAQRFILQCVFAMFSEDFNLLPNGFFTEIINECKEGASSYDLFGALFRQMNNPIKAKGGRFLDVNYFNGGLFSTIEPIDLSKEELTLLAEAASEDWSKVQPPIFGSLFEGSMGKEDRHALGAHFTYEADIKKIVRPTIEKYWKSRISDARTLKEMLAIRDEMSEFRVLDPACGCGNFLYVAFLEMRRLEMLLLQKVYDKSKGSIRSSTDITSRLSPHCYFGIDINPLAVELAKVTLMLAKTQSIRETENLVVEGHFSRELNFDKSLPLDNLDNNIVCDDALFCEWPDANVIIGNPPYQSKNKMQQEFGAAYVDKVRSKYADVPGRADYCVYWFRRAHDELKPNGRAGLVGTNTIRQNYSREGGLDYIVNNGGTIIEAVSSQPWSGDAVVHVSIVNWVKGKYDGLKTLIEEIGSKGNTNLTKIDVDSINSSLSSKIDLSQAKKLETNAVSGACYQGQTHGHKGFIIAPNYAKKLREDSKSKDVVYPYLTGDNLLSNITGVPSRYVISLNHCEDILKAKRHGKAYSHIETNVLPDMEKKALIERQKTGKQTGPRQSHFNRWWKYWRSRPEMMMAISNLNRYIVCSRVTKRPIFEFISSNIHPNDALQVFTLEDDYSFGILQSYIHWVWFIGRCSTLKEDYRYTSDSVFDTFPWPQSPSLDQVEKVAVAALNLRNFRNKIMSENDISLRDLYRSLDVPGANPLKDCHITLDHAVMSAYGMKKNNDPLKFLLSLNINLSTKENSDVAVVGPGLPPCVKYPEKFISKDCVSIDY